MPSDLDHAQRWFAKAESDFTAGRRILDSEGPYDTACFHAQQAAEKSLKGLLAFLKQPIPRIHDLLELYQQCLEEAPDLALSEKELVKLTPYAVQLRYDLEYWPSQADASLALETAAHVGAVLRARVPEKGKP